MSLPDINDKRFVPLHEQIAIAESKAPVTILSLRHGLSRSLVKVIKLKHRKSGKRPNS